MAHYAFLDENNVVVEVIVGKDEHDGNVDWEQHYGEIKGMVCKRTSYNTMFGKRNDGKKPFRKNYAGIGYTYDYQRDAFIPPQPFLSWILDEDTCGWKAPKPLPNNGKNYNWDEKLVDWVEV